MNFFWVNEKIFLVVCFFQFVYAYIISDHLPFDVAENVFCCGQFFYVNRHESNLFAILCYLFFVQVFFYVREFVKSCQKSFCWSFANSNFIFISQDEHCLFFDSSCFCFFFYWKFLDFPLYSCLAKWCCRTFFAFGFSIWNAHNCAEFNESLVKISCAIFWNNFFKFFFDLFSCALLHDVAVVCSDSCYNAQNVAVYRWIRKSEGK